MGSILIKDTTREQREQIVKDSLGVDEVGCGTEYGGVDYQLYIDGKMELRDLNMSARIYYQKAHPENDGKTSCMSNLQEGLRGAALCEGNKKIAVGNWNIW